jgi:hypothetical protein
MDGWMDLKFNLIGMQTHTWGWPEPYIHIWCNYGILGREITKDTVIYGVYIRSWPTLHMALKKSQQITTAQPFWPTLHMALKEITTNYNSTALLANPHMALKEITTNYNSTALSANPHIALKEITTDYNSTALLANPTHGLEMNQNMLLHKKPLILLL